MKAGPVLSMALLAIVATVVLTPRTASAECECLSNSVEQAVLDADRVFRGQIVSAVINDGTANDGDSRTIEFVVDVGDVIRGNPAKRYRLSTAMPDSCGVAVRLGFNETFVLGPGETTVSSCTGSGRAAYHRQPFLTTAIALVDLPVSDAREAQRLLSAQFRSSYDRSDVDDFFGLVERIDPTGNTATGSEDRIEYRGVVVLFTDGKYEKVEML